MLLQLFVDNTRLAMQKRLWILCFSTTSIKIWRSGAFSPLHLSEPLRKQKVVVRDLWLVDFDPFCEFLCFKVRCFVFEKHRMFYLSSKIFFIFFTLKHGKFRVFISVCKHWNKRNLNRTVSGCYYKHFAKLVIPSWPNFFTRIEIASQQTKVLNFPEILSKRIVEFKLVKRVKFTSKWSNLEQRNQRVLRRLGLTKVLMSQENWLLLEFKRRSANSYRPWINEIR